MVDLSNRRVWKAETKIGPQAEHGEARLRTTRLVVTSGHEASREFKRRPRVRGIVVFKTLILYEQSTEMCFFIGWREGGIKIPDL